MVLAWWSRLRMKGIVVLALGLVALVATAPGAVAAAPSYTVTPAGQALYEYEALIHQNFGAYAWLCGSPKACHDGWFSGQPAKLPLDDFQGFSYAFTGFGRSSFHLMPTWFVLPASAYPPPGGYEPGTYIPKAVTVNGRYVACNPAGTVFLVQYLDATGWGDMSCLGPAGSGGSVVFKLSPQLHAVSPAGQLLFDYEQLIYHSFGPDPWYCQGVTPASASTCHIGWFYKNVTSGAISYTEFTYAFRPTGTSPLRLMPSWFQVARWAFGVHPYPVTINGHLVACNRKATQFLVGHGDLTGAGILDCEQPL